MPSESPSAISAIPSSPRAESSRLKIFDRLLGAETEYAIRFTPDPGSSHPGNDSIYDAFVRVISARIATRPGERSSLRRQVFLENGGALYYEFLPQASDGGLIEGSTPECRGPSELLLYQKASEALLLRALPGAAVDLETRGHRGDLGLLKNCRDVEGHIYGAQENYEAELASGGSLFLYRVLLALLVPLSVLNVVVFRLADLLTSLVAIAFLMIYMVLAAVIPAVRRDFVRLAEVPREAVFNRVLGHVSYWLSYLITPTTSAFAAVLSALAFRHVRRQMLAFLASRSVVTGTGTLEADESFGLSEKATATRLEIRRSISPHDRPIFDTGNLLKDLTSPAMFRWSPLRRLFRPRQRLQLGLSDANVAQVAEYLKVGLTALVLDLVEAGALEDAPVLVDPVGAARALGADSTLEARVETRDGRSLTALQIQRWYLDRARAYLASSPTPSLEASEIVALWEKVLDALVSNPAQLIGNIDWVTKRYLLDATADQTSHAAKKKIDLKYHELGAGYLAQMEQDGLATVLVGPQEIERAMTTPPGSTPARIRGRMIRQLYGEKTRVSVSWDSIRIGGPLRGRVIRLDEHRPSAPRD